MSTHLFTMKSDEDVNPLINLCTIYISVCDDIFVSGPLYAGCDGIYRKINATCIGLPVYVHTSPPGGSTRYIYFKNNKWKCNKNMCKWSHFVLGPTKNKSPLGEWADGDMLYV